MSETSRRAVSHAPGLHAHSTAADGCAAAETTTPAWTAAAAGPRRGIRAFAPALDDQAGAW
jgi:hypothetical protein